MLQVQHQTACFSSQRAVCDDGKPRQYLLFFYSSSSLLMNLVSFLSEVWDGNKSHLAGASAIFEFEQEP